MTELGRRFKHRLLFHERDKPPKQIGDICSHKDSGDRRIAGDLVIHQIVNLSDVPGIETKPYILFSVHRDIEENIARLIQHLSVKRGAQIFLDSRGTKGILISAPDDADILGSDLAFKCVIIDAPKPTQTVPQRTQQPTQQQNEHQEVAAEFYSSLKREKATRHLSIIFHLRNLNNWVKSVLIQRWSLSAESMRRLQQSREGMVVLDLACGKGGDIRKWTKATAGMKQYVGADIAKGSLEDFVQRIDAARDLRGKVSKLIWADLGKMDLQTDTCEMWAHAARGWTKGVPLRPDELFDTISCQFAMHYFFETELSAHNFFRSVSRQLKPGGRYIATTVDSRVVVQKLLQLGAAKDKTVRIQTKSGEDVCTLEFEEEIWHRLFDGQPAEGEESNFFGLRYNFTLRERVDEAGKGEAVAAPEWLVPIGALTTLAEAYGMRVVLRENFHQFFRRHGNDDRGDAHGQAPQALLNTLQVLNRYGTFSDHEWEIAHLYLVIVLEKLPEQHDQSQAGRIPSSPPWPEPHPVQSADWKHHPSSMPTGPVTVPLQSQRHKAGNGTTARPLRPLSPPWPEPAPKVSKAGHEPAPAPQAATQMPRSPPGPPPGFSGGAIPRSPPGPPPGFSGGAVPRSPPGPPPGFTRIPQSPPGPPPGFSGGAVPRSPPGPPPGFSGGAVPRSPPGPPPGLTRMPQSPPGPPPGISQGVKRAHESDSDDSDDEEIFRIQQARGMLIERMGMDAWNSLSDVKRNEMIREYIATHSP